MKALRPRPLVQTHDTLPPKDPPPKDPPCRIEETSLIRWPLHAPVNIFKTRRTTVIQKAVSSSSVAKEARKPMTSIDSAFCSMLIAMIRKSTKAQMPRQPHVKPLKTPRPTEPM